MALYPYQSESVEKIRAFKGRALLALDMGLGKTAVSLTYVDENNLYPCIVVAPSCVTLNWKIEALKFTSLKDDDVLIVKSPKCLEKYPNKKLYILSYDRATKKAHDLLGLFASTIILDESHKIKNRKTKRTKQLVPLCKAIENCLLLTGTPILNRPEELWTQLQALEVDLGSWVAFGLKYCAGHQKRVSRTVMIWDFTGASNESELNTKLKETCMIRLTKAEIADQLPEKTRQKIVLEGVGKSLSFNALEKRVVASIFKNSVKASAWADLVMEKSDINASILEAYHEVAKLKIESVVDVVLNDAENDKLVVFANSLEMIAAIKEALLKDGISAIEITGQESATEKQKRVEAFQAGKYNVAICSLKGASVGITLTAASNIIIAQLPWTPGDAMQAEDRCHRIGQKNAVNIKYLVAENTIDDYLFAGLSRKNQVSNTIIDGETKSNFDEIEEKSEGVYWQVLKEMFDKKWNELRG